jgi:hypothetical protein
MQHTELLESANFPIEIGEDDFELVSGGVAIWQTAPTVVYIPPGLPPPPK